MKKNEPVLTFPAEDFAKTKRGLLEILEETARARNMGRLDLDEDKNFVDAILDNIGDALFKLDDVIRFAQEREKAEE